MGTSAASQGHVSTSFELFQHPRIASQHLFDYLNIPGSCLNIFLIISTSQDRVSISFELFQHPRIASQHLFDYLNISGSRLNFFLIILTS